MGDERGSIGASMKVHWFEQTLRDVSADEGWLTEWESSRLRSLRVPKRCADWRLGRWTAKHAVADYLKLSHQPATLAQIEIWPSDCGAPEATVGGIPGRVSISLSHRDGVAACAVGTGGVLGCDLELIEPRTDGFVADYFTAAEQSLIQSLTEPERFALITLLWSAKESALKAIRTGLRLDTRSVSVELDDSHARYLTASAESWHAMSVRYMDKQVFQGWWCQDGKLVRTLVSIPATVAPVIRDSVADRYFSVGGYRLAEAS